MPEPAEARPRVSLRGAFAVALLLVLAVSLARFQRGAEVARRSRMLARSLHGQSLPAAQSTRFWFDPDYAVFLEAVAERAPAGAGVAVLVPSWPDSYLYLAVYRLAPRRVVDARWMSEAASIAVYHTEAERGPGGAPIAYGTLAPR